ncbi:glycosyltransferase family 2 protein [uncultured Tateyamaria sp.]|uniref:glycosyltransferase family 2 protein n=1 Tax=uncultured Tateyamaria sp. TaxID=455651 RepID=UPI002636A1FE|nr:glycosyltransferase family 2 protein [uncultured Tateyamaria sp.]
MSDKITADLTVVLPTYERVEKLCELIDDLAEAQAAASFSVIIVNDKGPEEAYAKTRSYAEAHLRNLTMTRNSENIGIDGNIDRCLAAAETEYVLAIGDDDRLNVAQFLTLLETLSTARPDLMLVEYSYIYDDLSMQKEGVIDLPADQDFVSLDARRRFLFERATKLGFLGSVVFRTAAYRTHADPKFLGTWFNHVGAALNILFDDACTVTWFDRPVVLNRAGDIRVTSWSHRVFDVINGWWRMMALSCESHGKCSFAEYRAHKTEVTFQYDSPLWMLSRRSENLINFQSLPVLFQTFDLSAKTKAMYYAVCLVPIRLCLALKKSARAVGK